MNDNWGFSDEELDGLFRQAADGQRPRFEPEDWRRMAARLDEAGRDGRLPTPAVPWYRRWGWLGLLAGLLLLTGLAVWLVPASGPTKNDLPAGTPARSAASAANGVAPAEPRGAPSESEPARSSASGTSQAEERGEAAPALRPTAPAATVGERAATEQPNGLGETKKQGAEHRPTNDSEAKRAVAVSERISAKKTTANERRRTPEAPAGSGRGLAVVLPNDAGSAKKGVRSATPNATPERTRVGGQPPSEAVTVRPAKTAKPTRRAREKAPVAAAPGAGPQRTTRRTDAGRTVDFGNQTDGSDQRRETRPADPAPAATPDRWQTPNLARLNIRRVLFRTINLPVEAPSVGQVSAYYTPPARRAEVPPRGRFGVRALLAPDLNAVSRMQTFALGRSFGILAEYEFLPRWRVQAGAIRSQKDYGSTPDDYTPPIPGYWARYGRPETIDARCAILDVPLNVRFDALRRPRHDVFVSTGLSTYVMLDEVYDYHFANKPPYTHEVYRGGRHLASTLNLSAGYERQLGAGFSLQIEPYLKLPLAGVGWGSVRLYTTGLHLSVGFHRVR